MYLVAEYLEKSYDPVHNKKTDEPSIGRLCGVYDSDVKAIEVAKTEAASHPKDVYMVMQVMKKFTADIESMTKEIK